MEIINTLLKYRIISDFTQKFYTKEINGKTFDFYLYCINVLGLKFCLDVQHLMRK